MQTLVLYHKSCNDGITAAWLFWRYIDPEAEFQAIQYGEDPPDVTGRTVYVLDFSFKRDVMEQVAERSEEIFVYDHHKTAEAELAGLDYCVFDMEKSGARLVWDCLIAPKEGFDDEECPAPWLVDYTEDRDLWRWKLPESKEVSAALFSYKRTPEVWESLHEKGLQAMKDEGAAIVRYQDKIISTATYNAQVVKLDGLEVPCVNATTLVSEIGQELAKGQPFAAVYFHTKDGVVFSLRSAEDGADVSEIAKAYGGGGHKHAAGFKIPLAELPNFIA